MRACLLRSGQVRLELLLLLRMRHTLLHEGQGICLSLSQALQLLANLVLHLLQLLKPLLLCMLSKVGLHGALRLGQQVPVSSSAHHGVEPLPAAQALQPCCFLPTSLHGERVGQRPLRRPHWR